MDIDIRKETILVEYLDQLEIGEVFKMIGCDDLYIKTNKIADNGYNYAVCLTNGIIRKMTKDDHMVVRYALKACFTTTSFYTGDWSEL